MSAAPAPRPGCEGFAVERIDGEEALQALAAEWRALHARAPAASVFQSPDWLLAWWRRRGGGPLAAVALRRQGRLEALAPLFVYGRPGGGRQLTFVGNGDSDHLDALYADGAAAEALGEAVAAAGGFDACDLRDMPAASPFAARLAMALGAELQPEQPCPFLDLAEQPPRKMRRNLRYYARRAAEAGEARVRQADAATLAADLDTLVRLHAHRWPASPIAVEASVRAFHEEAAARLLAAGALRLLVLELDGAAIAALYGFHAGASAAFYLSGIDPAQAALSPGTLLFGHAVEAARQGGAATFDFLRGDEGYKYLWGARDRAKVRLLA